MANLIEIDEQIMRDVKRGIALSGSRLAFARKINVEHTTVRDWIRGKAKRMRSDILPKIQSVIADPKQVRRMYTAKVLKSIRLIRGIYAPEIQSKLGISTNCLYDYEKGRSFPKEEYADKLFGYLGIDRKVFRDVCNANFASGAAVHQTALEIISGKTPERKAEEAETAQDEYDATIISALKCGLKNLTEAEKTILFRMIVNFTTAPVKKEYFHE